VEEVFSIPLKPAIDRRAQQQANHLRTSELLLTF
jgi:hypothetical protein